MADDDRPADDIPWYAPGHHRIGIPRQRQPGLEVWRLRDPGTGRVQSCELRDDSRVGAGWDVMMLEDDEPLFSRRCVDERSARYVAQAFKQDTVRAGWVEKSSGPASAPAGSSAPETSPPSGNQPILESIRGGRIAPPAR